MYVCIANPTWGDIFECCFKAQSSKLERLFSLKRGKRDVRPLSFALSKMTPQVGLAVQRHEYVPPDKHVHSMHSFHTSFDTSFGATVSCIYIYIYTYMYIYIHIYRNKYMYIYMYIYI